ncbi:MAG: hypothetical protein AAF429_09260 [Pseudomonadota bacterium]
MLASGLLPIGVNLPLNAHIVVKPQQNARSVRKCTGSISDPRYLAPMRILILLAFLSACAAPNHLGNPVTLPIRAAISGVENANYARKRAAVSEYITQNQIDMRAANFAGPLTKSLLRPINPTHHDHIRKELRTAASHADFTERATVIIMVHLP